MRRKSPKVSGHFREYSRFGETIGGDGFDQDCRPTMALCLGQFSRPPRHGIGNLSPGLPRPLKPIRVPSAHNRSTRHLSAAASSRVARCSRTLAHPRQASVPIRREPCQLIRLTQAITGHPSPESVRIRKARWEMACDRRSQARIHSGHAAISPPSLGYWLCLRPTGMACLPGACANLR
jgi:hypothetical protein